MCVVELARDEAIAWLKHDPSLASGESAELKRAIEKGEGRSWHSRRWGDCDCWP